jgi:ABC-type transport system involved in cytochrome c biogenesis permease subunit
MDTHEAAEYGRPRPGEAIGAGIPRKHVGTHRIWFNCATWLHMRLIKGVRGGICAWWALVGLVVTTFAFLGVNIFLSGLHPYGEL